MPSHYMTILTKVGIIAIALVATLIILKILLVVARKILHKSSLDVALHTFVINAIRVIIIIVFIVGALDYLGFDTKSLITILGVSGAAIALALKDSLSNVAGGIIILATKPFSRMDYVDIGGT
ncbi:MAG: mechanosensitive ion channel, partial [Anaerovoracaceae bacterium]